MKPTSRIDEYGQHIDLRRRTFKKWCRDVWAAMTGKTWCSMRVTQGEREWVVECRQGYLFPIVGRCKSGISVDLLAWNDSHFFPPALRPMPPMYEEEFRRELEQRQIDFWAEKEISAS